MDDDLDPRRHLKLEGTVNTRDVGGYATADGGQIRWGRLLRSDSLDQLAPQSQQTLIDYGLRSVLDLRKSHRAACYGEVWSTLYELQSAEAA